MVASTKLMIENLGHSPIIKELEPRSDAVPYEEIRKNIESSAAVLVFLTSEVIKTEYTKNWVNYEVSTAAAYKKVLFLFEHIDDVQALAELPYPVPYVTDYMIFDKRSAQSLFEVQQYVKDKIPIPPGPPPALVGGGLGAVLGAAFGPLGLLLGGLGGACLAEAATASTTSAQPPYLNVKCRRCNTPYHYYSPEIRQYFCPVCRNMIGQA